MNGCIVAILVDIGVVGVRVSESQDVGMGTAA